LGLWAVTGTDCACWLHGLFILIAAHQTNTKMTSL
jgi:hypothetical protein